jgi:hypothetical protein
MKLCEISLTIFTVFLTISTSLNLKTFSSKEGLQIDNSKTVSLIIQSRPEKASLVNLKTKGSTLGYSFGMNSKDFLINAFNKAAMTIQGSDDHKIVFGARSMSVSSLSLWNNFKYQNQNQWRMFIQDSFNQNNTLINGWDYGIITKCGTSYSILGGFCQLSGKEIKKEISDLPPHKLIKIEVSFHFIGNWKGETGFLRVNGQSYRKDPSYLWTFRCNRNVSKNSSVSKTCGYNVCKFNYPVSISIPHIEQKLSLSFGSSLSNNLPCDRSYGISDFRVYIQ